MAERTFLSHLPNGAQVVSAEIPDAESVAIGIWIGVGGRHEPRSRWGISHFLEHMVFKGTAHRSARTLSLAIEGCGGQLNAFTQEDATCYFAVLPYEKMRCGLTVLSDMVFHARFSPRDIARERQVVIEEIRMAHDQPHQLVQEMAMEALWPDHPLGRPLTGSEASVCALNREMLIESRQRYYTPGNMVFSFAGRLSHSQCLRAVERLVHGIPCGRTPRMRSANTAVRGIPLDVQVRDVEQMQWIAAWPVFGRKDPRRYSLRVLNAILGENMSSRLFQSLRERHGLAYAVQSSYQLFSDTGIYSIQMGLDPDHVDKAGRLAARELHRLCEQPVSANELRRSCAYLAGQFRLGIESAANRMMWLGETVLTEGGLRNPAEIVDAIHAVRADDVMAVARDFFNAKSLSLVAVTPRKVADAASRMRDAFLDNGFF